MRLLIAEDDPSLGTFLARGLEQDGHDVTLAADGEIAMEAARNNLPDMAVLDLNLPQRDGSEVLDFLRSLTDDVPILILTARHDPETRLRCLEMGADDFMLKPFSFAELRARCRALLRRRSPGLILRQGELELNRVEHIVTWRDQRVALTNREFSLLEYLMMHRGQPVSRGTLLQEVWRMHPDSNTNVVDVYINYLRRKLHGPGAPISGEAETEAADSVRSTIRTVRGLGYTLGSCA